MTDTTRIQDDAAEAEALHWGASSVTPLRKGPAILIMGHGADGEPMSRQALGPNGEVGCVLCGSITDVESNGAHGYNCAACRDNLQDPV